MKTLSLISLMIMLNIGELQANEMCIDTLDLKNIDSPILVKNYLGSKMFLQHDIVDFDRWKELLSQDITLIAHFVKNGQDSILIFISKVEQSYGGYRFRILVRPEIIKPIDAIKYGYGYYIITTTKLTPSGKEIITSIKFDGVEI